MDIINEHNSEAYNVPFRRAIAMIDTRGDKSHVENDGDIIGMILDSAEPYYEDYEVHTSIGKPKNEWIVSPPARIAATPVGANIRNCLLTIFCTLRKNVVLPVPARPVRKKLLFVFAMSS